MIYLFGKAGSGKSTQGYNLAEKFGWKWLSVGQILRDSGKFDEELRLGKIVDSEVTIQLVNEAIEKAEAEGFNIVFDQYPRSDRQIEWMTEELIGKVDGVLILDVPEEELINRLTKRARMDDGDMETIRRRFDVFNEYVEKALPILEAKNVPVVNVDGVGTVEEVEARLITEVERLVPDARIQENDVNGGEIEHSYGE